MSIETLQWEQTRALFREAPALDPGDQPSKIYPERCAAYAQRPPPEDWDGVYEMTGK